MIFLAGTNILGHQFCLKVPSRALWIVHMFVISHVQNISASLGDVKTRPCPILLSNPMKQSLYLLKGNTFTFVFGLNQQCIVETNIAQLQGLACSYRFKGQT